jgi:hypothetical protein
LGPFSVSLPDNHLDLTHFTFLFARLVLEIFGGTLNTDPSSQPGDDVTQDKGEHSSEQ